jgi:hypothetical protein
MAATLPETPAPQVVERIIERVMLVQETQEQRAYREAKEKRDADKAKAVEGLVFPLRVVAMQDGNPRLASGKTVFVKKGQTFTVGRPQDYSHRWMKPIPGDEPDQVQESIDRAPKRTRRSGEDGNPETPSWQESPKAALPTDKGTSVI